MKKQVSGKDLQTAILLAVEQFFKKKFKTTVGEQRKYLNWEDLLTSPNISRLLMTKKSSLLHGQKQSFLASVKQALASHPIYCVLEVPTKNRGKKVSVIRRNCIYQKIQNHQKLVQYVFKRYVGTLVDEQLLNFSYKDVSSDIQKGVSQNIFVKMSLNDRGDFYIFPNLEIHSFGIKDWQDNYFQKEYLQICKEFGKQQERAFQTPKQFQIEVGVDNSDPNYKLPGFIELKKQWKIKQQLKLMAQLQQQKKAQLKQKEELQKRKRKD